MKMASKVTSRILNQRSSLLTKVIGGAAGGTTVAYVYAKQLELRAEREYEAALKKHGRESGTLSALLDEPTMNGNIFVPFLPRDYNRAKIERYWETRPVTVTLRVLDVLSEVLPIWGSYVRDFCLRPFLSERIMGTNDKNSDVSSRAASYVKLQHRHASALREAMTRLGPAFVKGGQQLSIRPDLIPAAVLQELQLLCDSVTPVDDDVAMRLLSEELCLKGVDELPFLFEDLKLVAAASLGQVYKATLVDTRDEVAIKVQRPDMVRQVSLDLFLIHKMAKFMDGFTSVFTEQAPYHVNLFDTFAKGSYLELDYENEASNQKLFVHEFQKRGSDVFIPAVYTQFSSRRVITTEWVDGIKLADADQNLIRRLIPVGVELFLTQLLDIGHFHADPHPGNLYVSTAKNGENPRLCLLDFGLCAKVDEKDMYAMTAAIVHLLIGDFESLISEDAKKLGFLPHSLDTSEIKPILTKILTHGFLESGSNLHDRKRKLMQISNELNEVFFRYPFSVPPFFALITRGLGLLEGIALTGDPDFDIFQASYPYARKRAVDIFGQHGINMMKRRMTLRDIDSAASK